MKYLTVLNKIVVLMIAMLLSASVSTIQAQEPEIKFNHALKFGFEGLDIMQDSDGFLWIGTSGGLVRYDGIETKFYKAGPDSISYDIVWTILEDRKGQLWIGTFGGLTKFDKETETFTQYLNDPDDPNSFSGKIVTSIYEDKSGVLWIGTRNSGLNKFNEETETFTHYQHDPNDPHSLGNGEVYVIYEDSAETFWIGTDEGLNRLDRETETFSHYKHDPDPIAFFGFLIQHSNFESTNIKSNPNNMLEVILPQKFTANLM
ncbi:two-component regulator propeller domain-containing protein [Anaerolineales bacterium HSG24]|nr:two-component regulator propeller domain-containing protein [Anaerolineales bacterium HSG24]